VASTKIGPIDVAAQLIVFGVPGTPLEPNPTASVGLWFDPSGTPGPAGNAGTMHLDVYANPGQGMPAWNMTGHPGDGTAAWTFFRLEYSGVNNFPAAGLPQLEAPFQLGLMNGGTGSTALNNYNLWCGGSYVAGGKGMTVWAKADSNVIDFQGLTISATTPLVPGTYDQDLRLNYLGGNVYLGSNMSVSSDGNTLTAGIHVARALVANGQRFPSAPTLPYASLNWLGTNHFAAALFGSSATPTNGGIELWGANSTGINDVIYLELQMTGATFGALGLTNYPVNINGPLTATSALISQGVHGPTIPAGALALWFDPQGTVTNGVAAGTAHLQFNANPTTGAPALNVEGMAQDGTGLFTYFRLAITTNQPGGVSFVGTPQIEADSQLGLFNSGFNDYNLWIGGGYVPGTQGMTVWARASEDAIDFQGMTVPVSFNAPTYDQDIRLNYLGGDVYIGPNANITEEGAAEFTSCTVGGSPVLTQAELPPGSFVYPPVGVAVSTSSSWGPSIDPTTLLTTNPSQNVLIQLNQGGTLQNWQIQGAALPPIPGTVTELNTGWIILSSGAGQDTTGTTGQAAGSAASVGLQGGAGGAAPAGSTNGNGGAIFLDGGAAGSGAGTPGHIGRVYIQSAGHGDTYIGGDFGSPHFHAAYGGQIDTTVNNNGVGLTTPSNGLTITWNLHSGVGETDFINSSATVGGGFYWYNVPQNTAVTGATQPSMILDSANNLNTYGYIYINDFATTGNTYGVFNVSSHLAVNATAFGVVTGTGGMGVSGAAFALGFVNTGTPANNYGILQMALGQPVMITMAGGIAALGPIQAPYVEGYGVAPAPIDSNGKIIIGQGGEGSPVINMVRGQSGTANQHIWSNVSWDGTLRFSAMSDDNITTNTVWLNVTRVAAAVTAINFSSTNFGINLVSGGAFTVAGGAKNFVVRDPLDDSKFLFHSCLEGPEHGVFYRGEVTTEGGVAEVALPDYFEALNYPEDRSILLTQVFEDDDVELALLAGSRIVDGKFRIRSSVPVTTVAWEVKAVRRIGTDRLLVRENVDDRPDLLPPAETQEEEAARQAKSRKKAA
jgi:hypothetical protein